MVSLLRPTTLITLLIFTCNVEGGIKDITWIDATISETILMQPEPAGLYYGWYGFTHFFVCRIQLENNGRWVPGKLEVRYNNRPTCWVADETAHETNGTFQVLSAPRGAVSWVPLSLTLPTTPIIGGSSVNGRDTYVCRAMHDVNIGVGVYNSDTGVCSFSMYDIINATSDIEILVQNMYGRELAKQNF